jgi:hypothetical protein
MVACRFMEVGVWEHRRRPWFGMEAATTQARLHPRRSLRSPCWSMRLRLIQECNDGSEEAFGWLMGVGGLTDDRVFSAENVCDALGVNVEALGNRLRHLAALGMGLHRMQRLPVAYKQRLGYRDKRRRAAHAP